MKFFRVRCGVSRQLKKWKRGRYLIILQSSPGALLSGLADYCPDGCALRGAHVNGALFLDFL